MPLIFPQTAFILLVSVGNCCGWGVSPVMLSFLWELMMVLLLLLLKKKVTKIKKKKKPTVSWHRSLGHDTFNLILKQSKKPQRNAEVPSDSGLPGHLPVKCPHFFNSETVGPRETQHNFPKDSEPAGGRAGVKTMAFWSLGPAFPTPAWADLC